MKQDSAVDVSMLDVIRILWRHRMVLLIVTIAVFAVSAVMYISAVPMGRSLTYSVMFPGFNLSEYQELLAGYNRYREYLVPAKTDEVGFSLEDMELFEISIESSQKSKEERVYFLKVSIMSDKIDNATADEMLNGL